MKAAVYRKNEGLAIEDVAMPEIGPRDVLVRVANTGFCGSDHSMLESGSIADGIVLGHEVSGTVAETGREVSGDLVAKRVVIRPTFCGACRDCRMGKPYFCQVNRRSIGIGDLPGGFAEYVKVLPDMLIPVPDGVDSRNAALAEAFAASYHGIACAGGSGGSALVLGGGTIGLALVRLLKLKGFGPVALSEPVEKKRELAVAFGADEAMDPLAGNLGAFVFEKTSGTGFEYVFECSGVGDNVQAALDCCARGGVVCIVSVIMNPVSMLPVTLNFKEVRLTASYSNTHEENTACLDLMARGHLDGRPLITDVISLEELPGVYRRRIRTGEALKVMLAIGEEF
ncbi:MAG: alcohol dehydrogenase catalytic domain-containing protein [Deltaproteobacteria bacterium]|nr:alcohol dehydrogenase catalytic domain-containing protein [Deltaproteobacteria bacterium]